MNKWFFKLNVTHISWCRAYNLQYPTGKGEQVRKRLIIHLRPACTEYHEIIHRGAKSFFDMRIFVWSYTPMLALIYGNRYPKILFWRTVDSLSRSLGSPAYLDIFIEVILLVFRKRKQRSSIWYRIQNNWTEKSEWIYDTVMLRRANDHIFWTWTGYSLYEL
jgi:hypothetical protein